MYLVNKNQDLVSFFVEDEYAHFFYIKREKHGYCVQGYKKIEASLCGINTEIVLNATFFADELDNFVDQYSIKNPRLSIGLKRYDEEFLLHYNLVRTFFPIDFHIVPLLEKKSAFRSIVEPKIENDLAYKAVNMWKEGEDGER